MVSREHGQVPLIKSTLHLEDTTTNYYICHKNDIRTLPVIFSHLRVNAHLCFCAHLTEHVKVMLKSQ